MLANSTMPEQKIMTVKDGRFVAIFLLMISAWFIVYYDALLSMESIWSRSDTFAHGYFILPISIWLLWRDKSCLVNSPVQLTWLPLPLLATSLFVGLFAYAADINVLGQLSAVTSLIFLLWALVGHKLAWHYRFPLVFLIFLVPMGENLIPWLQDVTAWFTVFFLNLNGIPVYVDGLYIEIPTGMFEVAVACSGIRYLIASAAVGALYAHLTYTKTHKQLFFFIFALTLPILANGIRAYGIVAIAYYSDMKYATGADHLVYGWFFFGIIMMLMFWIGGFFADKEAEEQSSAVGVNEQGKIDSYISITMITLPLLMVTYCLFKAIPLVSLQDTELNETSASSWGINFTDALEQGLDSVDHLHVFYASYANKQNQGELISSTNFLHNIDRWTVIEQAKRSLDNKPIQVVHLRNLSGLSRSYVYQYKIGDFYTVNKNTAKLLQAWNSLSRQSDTSNIYAVSIEGIDDLSIAEDKLLTFYEKYSFSPQAVKKIGMGK